MRNGKVWEERENERGRWWGIDKGFCPYISGKDIFKQTYDFCQYYNKGIFKLLTLKSYVPK